MEKRKDRKKADRTRVWHEKDPEIAKDFLRNQGWFSNSLFSLANVYFGVTLLMSNL